MLYNGLFEKVRLTCKNCSILCGNQVPALINQVLYWSMSSNYDYEYSKIKILFKIQGHDHQVNVDTLCKIDNVGLFYWESTVLLCAFNQS